MTSNGGPLNASSFVLDPQHRSALQARILFCPAEERTARELQQLPKEQREQVWADMTGHPETQQYRMTAESPALVQQQVNAMTEDIQSLLSSSTSSSVSTSSSEGEASHPSNDNSNDNSNNSHDATTTLSSISTSSFQAYRLARQRNPEYVEAQKIMFLRAEDFNAKAAAVRMLHFFDTLQSLRLPLGRDIRLSDLDVDDKESLEAGGMQWLPVTDHAGRAIVVTRQANYKYKTHDNMLRAMCYMAQRILKSNENFQRLGIISVSYQVGHKYQGGYDYELTRKVSTLVRALPMRFVAIYLCYSSTPWRRVADLISHLVSPFLRVRLRSVQGT